MKKLSFLLVLAFAFVFSAQAQKIGVKAGFGLSGYTTNFYTPEGSSMSGGINAGLVASMDFKILKLRADVSFVQLGSDFDSRDMSDEDWALRNIDLGGGNTMAVEYDYTTNVNYLNVGVSAVKSLGPVYLGVGPYFGYALGSSRTHTYETVTTIGGEVTTDEQTYTVDIFSEPNADYNPAEDMSDDNNPGGEGDLLNKTDLGANLILGSNLISGVFVEANVGYGFTNFINTDSDRYSMDNYTADKEGTAMTEDAKQNNLFFGISVGYTFGF